MAGILQARRGREKGKGRGRGGSRKLCCHVCVARAACDVSRIRVEAAIGIAVPGRLCVCDMTSVCASERQRQSESESTHAKS